MVALMLVDALAVPGGAASPQTPHVYQHGLLGADGCSVHLDLLAQARTAAVGTHAGCGAAVLSVLCRRNLQEACWPARPTGMTNESLSLPADVL